MNHANGNGWQAWTPEEDQRLASLVLMGETSRRIASLMGRTLNAVKQRRVKLGTPGPANVTHWAQAFGKPHVMEELAFHWGISLAATTKRKYLTRKAGYPVVKASDPRPRRKKKAPIAPAPRQE